MNFRKKQHCFVELVWVENLGGLELSVFHIISIVLALVNIGR